MSPARDTLQPRFSSRNSEAEITVFVEEEENEGVSDGDEHSPPERDPVGESGVSAHPELQIPFCLGLFWDGAVCLGGSPQPEQGEGPWGCILPQECLNPWDTSCLPGMVPFPALPAPKDAFPAIPYGTWSWAGSCTPILYQPEVKPTPDPVGAPQSKSSTGG